MPVIYTYKFPSLRLYYLGGIIYVCMCMYMYHLGGNIYECLCECIIKYGST